MNFTKSIILLILMAAVLSSTVCGKLALEKKEVPVEKHIPELSEKKNVPSEKDFPEFSLKDPEGKIFTGKDILKNGAVFVITAPIMNNVQEIEDWYKYLKAERNKSKGYLIFIHDMSPTLFKEKALKEIKKRYEQGVDPLFLIDPKGEVRKKLGVKKEDTIVLVFDKKGKRVHEESGKPTQISASQIWKSLE